MKLKQYQEMALDTLRQFLLESGQLGPKRAFITITDKPYNYENFGEIPFLCIKIPTGGGKTLVGCYAISEIMRSALRHKMDKGIVMWFVPSEAIQTQTLSKFRDRNDSHRRILDETFQNRILIFSNEEALQIKKEDIENNLCIIVSSLDAFRKDKNKQKKYRVYKENGALLSHFENISEGDKKYDNTEDFAIHSLANVIQMSNPLIVIDEGHKTKTQISTEFLNDLNPSFIIEYTATPRSGSNILVDTSPVDLKKEEMVKIPIILESSTHWQTSIASGLEKRKQLEGESKTYQHEYIRPIALIQAQPESKVRSNVTVDHIIKYLLSENIPREEIAIKTSKKNELEDINLFNRKCKIRYIVTVNALAEGWDCAFAYVLISVANVGAKIAVEQIIGRIIRMPYAKRKENEHLNHSYIFTSAQNFNEAANSIIDGLEKNGYSELDLIEKPIDDKSRESPRKIRRKIVEDFAVPMMSLHGEKLTFEELIGENFELEKNNAEFDFDIHYDSDRRATIDIEENSNLYTRNVQRLDLAYDGISCSENDLIQWLDGRLRYMFLGKADKVAFIKKAIYHQLKKKSLAELYLNRVLFCERLNDKINSILELQAGEKFEQLLNNQTMSIKPFESFAYEISLKQANAQEYNKSYYEQIEKLNGEELYFVERLDLDSLGNIKFWIRNRPKEDPFYIQGWKRNKFYPDFVATTKKGNIVALEWKGTDRMSTEDTEYKIAIGKIWEKLGKGNLHFFLVNMENVENVLIELKKL